ncbi:MAG: GDP-mannose 4,6-dehydratase, partial [bacterium]|nr:GDP-mannose 4,6-dehydratase [bacterium]
NVGGNCERTNLQVVHAICDIVDRLTGVPASGSRRDLIEFVTDRPGHDRRYAIDCSKIETQLGWRPEQTFETGLEETIAWYLANRDGWVEGVQSGGYRNQRLGLGADSN